MNMGKAKSQRINVVLVIFFFGLFVSCKSTGEKGKYLHVYSFSEQSDIESFSDLLDLESVIAISGTDIFLPSYETSSLEFHDSLYYFVDRYNGNVISFNSLGEVCLAFSNKGRGPGEYSMLRSFMLERDLSFWILDNGKMVHYSKEGNYIDEMSTPDNYMAGIRLSDSEFCFCSTDGEKNQLIYTNNLFVPVDSLEILPYSPLMNNEQYLSIGRQGQYMFSSTMCNSVCIYSKQEKVSEYAFDFGKNTLNTDIMNSGDYEAMYEDMSNRTIYYASKFLENSNIIFVCVTVLEQAEETRKAFWVIDKYSGSSRILFVDTDSPEWIAAGYPLLLTEDNEVYFISDTSNMDGFLEQTSLDSENDRPLLLKYHIDPGFTTK